MLGCSSCEKMCGVHKLAWALVWVGAINWGLIGLFQFDLVQTILGGWPMVVRVVYVLVGLSAVAMCMTGKCKSCTVSGEGKK